VLDGKFAQNTLACARQANQHLPPVTFANLAADEAVRHHAVDQFHRAMVPDLHPFREIPDCRALLRRSGIALHRQQELMMLRLDFARPRRRLAEMKEAPDLISELGQGLVFGHISIIS